MDLDAIPWPGGDWQATLRLFGALIGGYLLVLWFASILWVYRDIQSRSQDPVTQAIGVGISVVFPIVGLPVYLVVRPQETLQDAYDRQLEQEAILSELHSVSGCPNCRRPVQDDFHYCAFCGTTLKTQCSACGRLLQFSWRVCPTCQTPRPRPQPEPAEATRQREPDTSTARPASEAPPAGSARSTRGATASPAARRRRAPAPEGGEATGQRAEQPVDDPAPVRPRRPRPASGEE